MSFSENLLSTCEASHLAVADNYLSLNSDSHLQRYDQTLGGRRRCSTGSVKFFEALTQAAQV